MIKPTEQYILTFPEDENGEPVTKYRFILTLGKKIEKELGAKLQKAIGTLDGIDGINPGGRYTMELTIARTFEADEVIAELKKRLTEDVLSDIVRPKLTVVE